MKIRILIVEDHKLVREGLRALLDSQPGLEVVGDTGDGREGVAMVGALRPNLVLMDVSLPGLNGIEATMRIQAEAPNVKVLILSAHSDERCVADCLRAGATGFLVKTATAVELKTAIMTAVEGRTYLSPEVAGAVVRSYLSHLDSSAHSVFSTLTGREREVLQALAEGATTKHISRLLGVSVKTVESHRANVMHKLSLHSMADLVKYAIREGLVTSER